MIFCHTVIMWLLYTYLVLKLKKEEPMFKNKLKLVIAVLLGFGLLTPMFAAKTYRIKIATFWPTNFPVFGEAVENFKKRAEEMSDGQIKVRIDTTNKHKSAKGIFDMVKAGQYDMGHAASYYWKGKVPNTLFFTTMPFGMTAPEQYAWFYYGGGMELMEKVYAPHNLLSFPGGNTGNQMGGWFKKEINTVADLKGLKMRIPGFAGEVLAKLGANPTNIPPGELYTAIDRGTIDALEWVGPSLDMRMGFHKVAPYYYTGWHEPGTELQFLVNKKKFEKYPKHIQAILTNAMRVAAYDMYIQSMHDSGENWAKMSTEYANVKVKSFPKDVMDAISKANSELLVEFAKKDPQAKEILDSQAKYMKQVRPWTMMSDFAYLESVK